MRRNELRPNQKKESSERKRRNEMKMSRIATHAKISVFLCLVLTLSLAVSGYAQESKIGKYPDRPITFIHPLPAGGGADILTRILCKDAEKYLGQPIVIVNKPGGSLTVGAAALATSKPDGYTIGFTGATALLIAPFIEKLPYDPIKDFQQIMQWGAPNFGVTVKADSPFKSFKDIVAYARQNPKKLTYGTTGQVGLHYLIMEQIARKEKVQFTQIPFKGGSEVEAALLGGHIQFGASEFSTSQIEAGNTRLLLLLREEHAAEYPKTSVLKDLGYTDIAAPMIQGIAGPKGLPEAITKKLEEAFTKAMKEPTFIKGMKDVGYSVLYRNSKESSEYIAKNYEFFGKFLKELGLAK
jgi:tripartite-type tricarboxylate transporter receptor subunit TctC